MAEPELHFLLEAEEDPYGGRTREATIASIVFHLAAIVFLLLEPSIFNSVTGSTAQDSPKAPPPQLTYLAMPPDQQVVKIKPKTDTVSDKDRVAQRGLPPLPQNLPPLPPAPPKPAVEKEKAAAEQEKKQVAQAAPPPSQQLPGPPVPQPGQLAPPIQLGEVRNQQPKLPMPDAGSPGHALEETLRGLARDRSSGGGQSVDLGPPQAAVSPRTPGAIPEAQILSDTMGVDFDPYLRRVIADIRRNWYSVMPEIARMGKRGRVAVVFEISRDGQVPKLYLVAASGSDPLDRAALAGISASVPLPPLPPEFKGPMVRVQVTFLYNMAMSRVQ